MGRAGPHPIICGSAHPLTISRPRSPPPPSLSTFGRYRKATQEEIDKIVEWTTLSEDELSDRLVKNEKEGDRDVPDLLLMVFSSDSDCAEAGGWIAEIVRLRPAFYDAMARVMCGARSVRLIHSEVVKTAVRALCHDVTKLDVCDLISATSHDDPSWMDPPSQAQCDGFVDESGVVGKPGATVPIMMGTCISEVAQVTELLENVMDILYGGKGAWEQMRKLYLALLRTPIEKEVVYRLFAKIFTHVRDGVKSHRMGSGNRTSLGGDRGGTGNCNRNRNRNSNRDRNCNRNTLPLSRRARGSWRAPRRADWPPSRKLSRARAPLRRTPPLFAAVTAAGHHIHKVTRKANLESRLSESF